MFVISILYIPLYSPSRQPQNIEHCLHCSILHFVSIVLIMFGTFQTFVLKVIFHLLTCRPYCFSYKKLSYRRGTARCVVSVEILPIATQQCRNYLYDKS